MPKGIRFDEAGQMETFEIEMQREAIAKALYCERVTSFELRPGITIWVDEGAWDMGSDVNMALTAYVRSFGHDQELFGDGIILSGTHDDPSGLTLEDRGRVVQDYLYQVFPGTVPTINV